MKGIYKRHADPTVDKERSFIPQRFLNPKNYWKRRKYGEHGLDAHIQELLNQVKELFIGKSSI